jgi:hypothetical protein
MSAKGRGSKVADHEFYPTPPSAIQSLLNELEQPDSFFRWGEPCAGDGVIIAEVWKRFRVEPSQWEWAELREGKDYLKQGLTGRVDCIITNPPFSLATSFLDKSLESPFVAYLLRLNFLGSGKRKDWWQGKEPTHLFTLSKRPSFTGKGTDATEYAWFVWDHLGLCKRDKGVYVI